MKPRTKKQQLISDLSAKIPKLTDKQKNYALYHCLDHKGTILKSGRCSCLDCGHQWLTPYKLAVHQTWFKEECPNCRTELKFEITRKKNFFNWAYFGVITTFSGYQVIRLFLVNGRYKVGKESYRYIYEVSQIWMDENGGHEIVGMNHGYMMGWGSDMHWYGGFELRDKKAIIRHDIMPYRIYPTKKVLPIIKRNGFKGGFHGMSPYSLFHALLTNTKAETLMKCGQYSLMKSYKSERIHMFWPSIKICIRNGYLVKDSETYFDYLMMLHRDRKDIRNPRYICPENLRKSHDKLLHRSEIERRRKELENKRKEAEKHEEKYQAMRERFFDLVFTENDLSVHVLKSVQEFVEEGLKHHHCVYASNYFLKKDSLIMSARIDGIPVETVEISLSTLKIVQARGLYNKPSDYHDRIIKLVSRNMSKVRKKLKNQDKQMSA